MSITVIHSSPAWFDVPAFTFLRPQVTPGDQLFAVVVTASPAALITPGWERVAGANVDQGLAIYRRIVDGSEPAIMSLVTDCQTVNANICMVFAVQGTAGGPAVIATNLYSNGTTDFVTPAMTKEIEDLYIGIICTNGSSERLFAPSDAVVHANIRDAGFASTSLLVFEVPSRKEVAEQHVLAANSQPGFAAALVLAAAYD